ncbi:MAG: glutamate 5-kinase [Candidatus Omnitrophica bacterium]|nr:glutamate 5-kinase [Candidatus Omnitrophota bacterium]
MKYKKIVVKIGTSVLAKKTGEIDSASLERIACGVACIMQKGARVILVSSGAIGAGMSVLKLDKVPASLSDLQATAAIGQSQLMHLYSAAFKKYGYSVGQILLTQEDFDHRRRYLNIKYTVDALLAKGAVPVVNENDTVSTEEIKCGDNDRLSSLMADLWEADALVMLTDVDGLYDEKGRVLPVVENISDSIKKLAGEKVLRLTKGGMVTKLASAERAVAAGIDCFIANGRAERILIDMLESGKGTFTYFKSKKMKKKAKKRWIAYSSKIKGKIIVDDGAKKALVSGNKSLLASGITAKDGAFKAGDVIGICDTQKKEFARGLANYSSEEIGRIKGVKASRISSILGYKDHDEVVRRDNLVIL